MRQFLDRALIYITQVASVPNDAYAFRFVHAVLHDLPTVRQLFNLTFEYFHLGYDFIFAICPFAYFR